MNRNTQRTKATVTASPTKTPPMFQRRLSPSGSPNSCTNTVEIPSPNSKNNPAIAKVLKRVFAR